MRWQQFFALLAITVLSAGVGARPSYEKDEFTNAESKRAVLAEKIDKWIRQLGHLKYRVRERATMHLRQAGAPAIDPVLETLLKDKDWEVLNRAERILLAFWKSKDPAVKKKAKEALAKLADSKREGFAHWAESLLDSNQRHYFTGILSRTDPHDRVRRGHPHKVHTIKMVRGRTYQIDLTAAWDTYLRLEDDKRTNLVMDDDGGVGLNSRIIFRAPRTATYRVIVTNFSTAVGPYTLQIQFRGRR